MSDPLAELLGEEERQNNARSVVDGRWVQASVSQLKTASLCVAKWWYDKIKRYPRKLPSKGLKTGLKCHTENEHYLKNNQDAMGPITKAGKHLLPLPGPGLLMENRFDWQPKGAPFVQENVLLRAGDFPFDDKRRGVALDGYIDLINGRHLEASGPVWTGGPVVGPRVLVLVDYKFSKNVEAYGAEPEHLIDVAYEHGIQMMGYAEWARLEMLAGRLPPFDRALVAHFTYQTEKHLFARPCHAIVDHEHVAKEWVKVNPLAAILRDVAKETDETKIPFNEEACGAFGGCDFAAQCPHSPLNKLITDVPEKEEDMTSMLDSLLGAANAQAQASAPPPPPPAPQLAAPPAFVPPPPPAAPAAAPAAAPEVPLAPGWILVEQAQPGAAYFIQAYGKPMKYLGRAADGTPIFDTGDQRGNVALSLKTHAFPIPAPQAPPVAAPGTAVVGVGPDGRPLPAVLPPDAAQSNPLTSSEPTMTPPAPAPTAEDEAAKKLKKAQKAADKAAEKARALAAAALAPQAPAPAPPAPAPVAVTQFQPPPAPPPIPAPPAPIQAAAIPFEPPAGPVQAFTQSTAAALGIPPAAPPAAAPQAARAPAPSLDWARVKLFFGCRPDAGSNRLDDYTKDLVGKMCAKYGVKDPRLTPKLATGSKDKDHPLAFDGWRGILTGIVALSPPPPGSYHYTGTDEFNLIVANALAALLPAENVARAG